MLGVLFQAWAAFSPLSSMAFVLGAAAVVTAFIGAVFVPDKLKMPLIAAGIALMVGASLWQAAEIRGAHEIYAATQELALKAEAERADKAEAITRDLAEQATKDLADAQADTAKLKGLDDVLSKDPDGARVAVPRVYSRRLRNL